MEMFLSQKNEKMAFMEKQQLNRKLPDPTPSQKFQKRVKRL